MASGNSTSAVPSKMTTSNPGKVALVTGASRGIGRAIACELGRLKHAVFVNYATRRDAADEVVTEIEAGGGTAFAVQGNVALAEDRAYRALELVQPDNRATPGS